MGSIRNNATEQGINRIMPKEDTQFKKGVSGNPGGRPKNTLKDYMKKKFMSMSPEDKDIFLKQVSAEIQWKMAEGNPHQDTDVTSQGEKLETGVVVLPSKEE